MEGSGYQGLGEEVSMGIKRCEDYSYGGELVSILDMVVDT
jgi:hypothetical protein